MVKHLLGILLAAAFVFWIAGSDSSLPKCFKDKNRDGICDNSQNAGQKCKKNCMTQEAREKQQKKANLSGGCSGCAGGDCSKCALFAL